jgi:calcineurin-like phosphoesterase family protein
MTIWFSADTHLNHFNIIKYCNRPFKSVEEMDETIINNWNSVISNSDVVYFLGDFCMGDPRKYLSRLQGKIIFISGDHDKNIIDWVENDRILTILSPHNDEYGNPRIITLCHYAMRSWPKSHYASWHLFGHHHGKLEPYGLSFDVGIDTNNFFPYSLEDIEKKMKTLKPIVDFRKKEIDHE